MGKVSITLPETVHFSTELAVRITDINYGGHLGNDRLLGLVHEARVLWLRSCGWSELNCAGSGLIMADTEISFKAEAFSGETLVVTLSVAHFSSAGFDIFYQLHKKEGGVEVARIRTGMAFFDYEKRRPVRVPDLFRCRFAEPAT
ncbi:MAG: hypothetical protein A2X49_12035 [Lentisphaerae bacterium GWF2_52_8]|nr:MAG: hypothetical protein A2X49_12035 [Lentisphaerae bacterium GWF2_52_8]